jgi:hypothetical protein
MFYIEDGGDIFLQTLVTLFHDVSSLARSLLLLPLDFKSVNANFCLIISKTIRLMQKVYQRQNVCFKFLYNFYPKHFSTR